jgi:hypothetical protein
MTRIIEKIIHEKAMQQQKFLEANKKKKILKKNLKKNVLLV